MLDAAAENIDHVETAGAVLENVGECVVWFNCADPDSPGSQLQRERADPGSDLEYVRSSMGQRAREEPFVVARRILLERPKHLFLIRVPREIGRASCR